MNTEHMIEITGADLAEVAKAAYDLSSPQGSGFMHYKKGSLTDEEAADLIQNGNEDIPLRLDYVKGRSCKLKVWRVDEKLFIKDQWYDHSEAQLQELLDRIKGMEQ